MASLPHGEPPLDGRRLGIRDQRDAMRLFAPIAREALEVLAFAYFDPEWGFLGMRYQPSCAIDMVSVCARQVARDALAFDAALVLMAHNHPSGDARPSADDVKATRALAKMLAAIDVHLVDHLVLTIDASISLKAEGLI